MSRTCLALAPLLAIAAVACSGSPLSPDASGAAGHPSAGTGGTTTGDAGTTGAAGTGEAGGGAAGTTGVAGTTGAAGATDAAAGTTGATDAAAGTTGTTDAAAGTTGGAIAGIDAPIEAPSSFDALVRPEASADGATLPDGRCIMGAFQRPGGVCTCQTDIPIACGASCIDPTTDDDNCGVCGNKCGATATCQRGTCGPAPVTFLPSVAGCQELGVAVSGNRLFWTDKGHNTVSSVPVTGGAITTLSSVAAAPTTIVATGGTAFWLESGTRTISRSTGIGPAATVVTSATAITNFTVSEEGTTVFFSTGTTVMKVLASGGAAVPVVSEDHAGEPGALALLGASFVAFPTAVNGDVDIAKLTPGLVTSCGKVDVATGELLPNANCTRVARSQGGLVTELILIRNNRVFWADGANLKANDIFTGIQANDNIAQTNGNILGLTATASTLYFGDSEGVVYKSPTVNLSTPLRIARAQSSPRSFAVDASRVYWSTTDCTIKATGL